MAGYFHGRPPLHLERVLESCRPPALLLLLDGIQDPQNLGALIRTAEAVGVDAVITPRHRAAALTPAAVKASAGASEHLSVITVTNLAQALARIGEAGIWRVGLAAEAGGALRPGRLPRADRDRDRRRGGGDSASSPGGAATASSRCR